MKLALPWVLGAFAVEGIWWWIFGRSLLFLAAGAVVGTTLYVVLWDKLVFRSVDKSE